MNQDGKETPPYVPTQKEQADITYAMNFRKQAYEDTRQERQEARVNYLRYKQSLNLSDYDFMPDVHLGLTYDAVERITATLPGREFGFKARPVGMEDTKNALLVSEVIKTAWNSPDIMDGPSKMDIIKKGMVLFPAQFAQVYWKTEVDENGDVIKSDPCLIPLNFFDCYYNKFIPEIDHLPEFGLQTIVSLQWLKDNAKLMGFKNTKYVKGFTPKQKGSQDEDSSTIDSEETLSGQKGTPTIAKLFEVQTNKEIMTFAIDDGQVVWLRKVPNKIGRKNIVIFRYKRNPLPNRLLGVTDITRGGNIEDSIQRATNQMVFNSLLVDNPTFSFDSTDQNIDPRTFVSAPGAGIPRGKNPDALTPISFQSHMNDSMSLINFLVERYKKVVNIPDIIGGTASGNTATSDSLNDSNAKVGIDKVVDGMKGSMQHMASLLVKLYETYGPESLTVQVRTPELADELSNSESVTQNSAQEISRADFSMPRDIDVVVEFTSQNKSMLSRRIVEWLNITAQDQTVPPQLRMQGYQKWLEFNDLDDLAAAYAELAKTGQTSDINLAEQENAKMAGGTELPPTPNASQAHTQRHVDFMRRADTGPEIDRLLQAHIEGELQALQAKQMAQMPEAVQPTDQGMSAPQDMGQEMMPPSTDQMQPNTTL